MTIDTSDFRGIIFDLDGVLTRTADLHARAWEGMFNEYFEALAGQGRQVAPFDIERDYPRYVDGKPRYEGVRSLLESRGIQLEFGTPQDPLDRETICGLGNRKNRLFQELLEKEGARVWDDGVALVLRARAAGLVNGIVTSSRNGRKVLDSVDLTGLFDVIVDGNDAADLGLTGKPSPDIFLAAARKLGIPASQAVVVEDAISGVQAGRAGGFGLVVGVDRVGREHERELLDNGADLVFSDLGQLILSSPKQAVGGIPPSALDILPMLRDRLQHQGLSVFLDYDGTLTPIVPRPEDAVLSAAMRAAIDRLARCLSVGIVSGRDLADVKNLVNLDSVVYAGDHGFNIDAPGQAEDGFSPAKGHLPAIRKAAEQIKPVLEDIPGAWLEEKTYTMSLHFRETPESRVGEIRELLTGLAERLGLRLTSGKKVFELRPGLDWDKGKAIQWLRRELDLETTFSLYIGDDTTDEDGFKALGDQGLGILVTDRDVDTLAGALLNDTSEVEIFLNKLVKLCQQLQGEDT